MSRGTSFVVALVGVPLMVAGCSFSASVGGPDYGKLETQIKNSLNKNYEPLGLAAGDVKCNRPKDTPKAGDTFTCSAPVEDKQVRTLVTMKDDDNVTFETMDNVVVTATASKLLTDSVSDQQGKQVTVDCGEEKVLVVPNGDTFDCSAQWPDGSTAKLVATPKRDGTISWETQ